MLTKLEFVDKVAFGDEFYDVWDLSFKYLFDVVPYAVGWGTCVLVRRCDILWDVFYSKASLTYIAYR